MRRLGTFSLWVVAPVLFLVSSCMRSQPTSCIAPAFFAYVIPIYVHFYVNFWFILSNPRPPVVVAFGHACSPVGWWPLFFFVLFLRVSCVRSQPTNCIAPALFACGVVAPVFFSCFISASTPQPTKLPSHQGARSYPTPPSYSLPTPYPTPFPTPCYCYIPFPTPCPPCSTTTTPKAQQHSWSSCEAHIDGRVGSSWLPAVA
jgi:hypothetical protein